MNHSFAFCELNIKVAFTVKQVVWSAFVVTTYLFFGELLVNENKQKLPKEGKKFFFYVF